MNPKTKKTKINRTRPTTKERIITISTGLTESEIRYLDRKINRQNDELSSRSAILRYLARYAMENNLL